MPFKSVTARSFAKLLQSEPFNIVIGSGDSKDTYPVPRDLLICRSEYFRKCLKDSSNFREHQNNEVELSPETPPVTVVAFQVLLFWLYHDSLPSRPRGLDPDDPDDRSCITDWLEAYLLMQYLDLREGQNAIMQHLCDLVPMSVNPLSTVKAVKEGDVELVVKHGNDALNHFIVDAVYYSISYRPIGSRSLEENFPKYAHDDEFRLRYYKACADRVIGRLETEMEMLKRGGSIKSPLLVQIV